MFALVRPAFAAEPTKGWMVIVAGDADPKRAEQKLRAYQARGPRVGTYPKLFDSSKVEGLNPGFHIVVAGIPRDGDVARQMAKALGREWDGAYVREVTVDDVEDARCDGKPTDPRCVPGIQVLGHAAGTAGGGDPGLHDEDPRGPVDGWKALATPPGLPGSPRLYQVHEGGGEGDCAVQVLEFGDAAGRSRLFFDSGCFGDTSEMSTTPSR